MSNVDQKKLPSGWTLTPVGDLVKFKNGLNKGKAYFGYGTPIVNYMDVFRHAGLRRTDVHGLVDVTNAEKQAFSARKGDILFTRTSETPEEVGISTVLLEDIEDAVFSGFVLRGRPVNDRLNPEFAQYCFNSRFVRGQIVSSATYTTRALTNGRILSNVKLPLPDDPDEQQAIAAALSDVDEVVAGLERVIAKKRLIKQGAMQDLLTARRRLPGFSGEWEVRRLGELVNVARGASPRPIDSPIWFDENSSVGWVRISDLSKSDIFLKATTQRLSQEGIKRSRRVEIGSLIMSIAATLGRPAITQIDVCIHDGFVVLTDLKIDKFFFFHLLKSLEPTWALQGQTGSQMNLNTGIIEGANVRVPPSVTEQEAIAKVFNDMDAEIQTLEARLTKARAVKEGTMQNLLTGRVRLV